MRTNTFGSGHSDALPDPIPFPGTTAAHADAFAGSPEDVLAAIESASRRIDDLARELRCLGYFDDENADGPRAA